MKMIKWINGKIDSFSEYIYNRSDNNGQSLESVKLNYRALFYTLIFVAGASIVYTPIAMSNMAEAEAERLELAEQERLAKIEAAEQESLARIEEAAKKQAELEAVNLTLEEQRKAINDQLWTANQKLSTCEANTEALENELNKVKIEPVREESQPAAPAINQSGYVPGTCSDLRGLGLSNFTIGDPNYTRARDRDGDGIACE